LDACLQGVKFALNSAQVPAVSKLDHDTLHLVWTEERLQQQLDVLDRRWEISRRRALASFKSGDKQGAYRYVRQSKVFSQSRNRCTQLLERVEEVISLIASAESTKKVRFFTNVYILVVKLFVCIYITMDTLLHKKLTLYMLLGL